MDLDTQAILTGCSIIGITASIGLIIRHIINDSKHPCKEDIVFQDVCEAKMKGTADCIEAKLDSLKETIDRIESKLDKINKG